MLFERVSRKIFLAPPKTNSSIFSGQMRLKKSFLAEKKLFKHTRFGGHEDKKYPMYN